MCGIAPARTIRKNRVPGCHCAASRASLALLCLVGVCLLTASAASARGTAGEPFFPASGSSAYDVSHYDVRLSYRPSDGELTATARIDATATRRSRRLSLDLDGLTVSDVSVDGAGARFSRGADKLDVVPARPLEAGQPFTAVVHYGGTPRTVIDPDGSAEGWIRTGDGAVGLGEPVGTAAWLPCNDTLRDKASFSFRLSVPEGLKAVANGRLLAVRRHGGRRTFEWSESEPMAPYLAVVDIGRGRLTHGEVDGIPTWTFVDAAMERSSRRVLRKVPEILRFESRLFGPYPFDAAGSILDRVPVEYALETQTRPTYAFQPGTAVVAHETAHQWFGDSVGLTRWPEIWLNEGFATWAEWFYAERHGGVSAQRTFNRLYRVPASAKSFWDPPSSHPGSAKNLFGPSVYLRGGMALQALRMKIGTGPLLAILRDWAAQHRYANATIPEFIALAEEVSGRALRPFFNAWLYQRGKPPGYG